MSGGTRKTAWGREGVNNQDGRTAPILWLTKPQKLPTPASRSPYLRAGLRSVILRAILKDTKRGTAPFLVGKVAPVVGGSSTIRRPSTASIATFLRSDCLPIILHHGATERALEWLLEGCDDTPQLVFPSGRETRSQLDVGPQGPFLTGKPGPELHAYLVADSPEQWTEVAGRARRMGHVVRSIQPPGCFDPTMSPEQKEAMRRILRHDDLLEYVVGVLGIESTWTADELSRPPPIPAHVPPTHGGAKPKVYIVHVGERPLRATVPKPVQLSGGTLSLEGTQDGVVPFPNLPRTRTQAEMILSVALETKNSLLPVSLSMLIDLHPQPEMKGRLSQRNLALRSGVSRFTIQGKLPSIIETKLFSMTRRSSPGDLDPSEYQVSVDVNEVLHRHGVQATWMGVAPPMKTIRKLLSSSTFGSGGLSYTALKVFILQLCGVDPRTFIPRSSLLRAMKEILDHGLDDPDSLLHLNPNQEVEARMERMSARHQRERECFLSYFLSCARRGPKVAYRITKLGYDLSSRMRAWAMAILECGVGFVCRYAVELLRPSALAKIWRKRYGEPVSC